MIDASTTGCSKIYALLFRCRRRRKLFRVFAFSSVFLKQSTDRRDTTFRGILVVCLHVCPLYKIYILCIVKLKLFSVFSFQF